MNWALPRARSLQANDAAIANLGLVPSTGAIFQRIRIGSRVSSRGLELASGICDWSHNIPSQP